MIERYRISEDEFDFALQNLRPYLDMPQSSGVYAIVNVPTGRVYVGRSKNMHRRAKTHISELRSGIKDSRIQDDFLAHGEESMRFAVVVERNDPLEVFWCELQALKIVNDRDCYNTLLPHQCQSDPEQDFSVRERLGLDMGTRYAEQSAAIRKMLSKHEKTKGAK